MLPVNNCFSASYILLSTVGTLLIGEASSFRDVSVQAYVLSFALDICTGGKISTFFTSDAFLMLTFFGSLSIMDSTAALDFLDLFDLFLLDFSAELS